MIHVGVRCSWGQSTGISKHYGNPFDNPDWKAPLRCGIKFCTLSCILFVAGIVLTWLGIHDIFGETVPITGPILLTVGALFLILASRQFYLARARKKLKATKKEKESADGKKTAVVDADDGTGPSTILIDQSGPGKRLKDSFNDKKLSTIEDDEHEHEQKVPCSPSIEPGTYVWPSIPYQPSPFTCVSMMLGKDPSLLFGLAQARPSGVHCAYSPGTVSTSLSPSQLGSSLSPTSPPSDHVQTQPPYPPASASITVSDHSSVAQILPGTVAVVAASGDDNINNTPSSPSICVSQDPTSSSSDTKSESSKLSSVISSGGLPAMVAREGISNFPGRTAIMMLRTLEIQETI